MIKPILFCMTLVFVFAQERAQAGEKFQFGRFASRAIFERSQATSCPAPLVIMVPGSGPNGPEEMAPASVTGDGQIHSLFASYSEGLRRTPGAQAVGTLQIGKPGIEFYNEANTTERFYDQKMYENLEWQDLLNNVVDAIEFAKTLPCVDPKKISIFGHSEGTQVAVDFADAHPELVSSLVLVGFSGENLETTVNWQLFRRILDSWLIPDVDTNHDEYISREEASTWPDFKWNWKAGIDRISYQEIEDAQKADPNLQAAQKALSNLKIWKGVYQRPPLYPEAAKLKQKLFVFTGDLDVQTRPEEALRLGSQCHMVGKDDCQIKIMPGLGHGMSAPRGPRKQKLLDATLGPVDESFLVELAKTAPAL